MSNIQATVASQYPVDPNQPPKNNDFFFRYKTLGYVAFFCAVLFFLLSLPQVYGLVASLLGKVGWSSLNFDPSTLSDVLPMPLLIVHALVFAGILFGVLVWREKNVENRLTL